MVNKVFVVTEEYDNCESYEDHYWFTTTVAVTSTREEAEKIVENLYNKILSITTNEFGGDVTTELRKDQDDEIEDVLVTDVKGYSRTSGSYSYGIEEFELGKVKEIGP